MSVRGRARVVKERMNYNENFAILEIDIEEVKNDIVNRIVIESGITISAQAQFASWYDGALAEAEE